MERLFPARPSQRAFGAGFFNDCLWVLLALPFTGLFMGLYAEALRGLYDRYLAFLTIEQVQALPYTVRVGASVLLADFLAWFQHRLKHTVPWFWEIHAVHHSQRELNFFTDYRFHYFEYLISKPIVLLPLLMTRLEMPAIAAYGLFSAWFPRFYHANIRTDLGWLRYLLVTPQSHRVHHSIEPKHRDLNFGVIFSFWDRLFGTCYTKNDEYPETGIPDPAFPVEEGSGVLSTLLTPVRQMVYPFMAIGRSLLPGRRKE